ncbi:hypothetical protein KC19_4G184000 [Ceratodon purpureus]|uniref:Secreted protein n=1 Tax=Ceratodon purpureus TaxID=3225 RepID=A0A8T0ICA6_CERPU|nr:hypothetical protein KC19_4G184000 [Ceratodon purpureus]
MAAALLITMLTHDAWSHESYSPCGCHLLSIFVVWHCLLLFSFHVSPLGFASLTDRRSFHAVGSVP